MAAANQALPIVQSLGLTLQGRTGIGAEVIRVDRGSAGDRVGLLAGDLITLIAALPAPTPTQVSRAFSSLSQGQRVMIGVTRDDRHFVTTLAR
jgi:S1-C subfamily serine protease